MVGPAAGRLPAPLRRVVGGAARRLGRGRAVAAVVVLMDGEPGAVRRALAGAVAQNEVPVEIVAVVLDEELSGQAAERAALDPRVRVLHLPGATRETARRTAVSSVRAPAVIVVVPGAELLRGAVAALVDVRRGTGAPVVLGGLAPAPAAPRGQVDLARWPEAARLPLLARLLVDRRRLAAMESTVDDADGTVTALGLLRQGFAVAPGVTLRDVPPGAERSLFRSSPWGHLDRLVAAEDAAQGVLVGLPRAAARRRSGLLERDVAQLLQAVEDASATQWDELVGRLSEWVPPGSSDEPHVLAGPGALDALDVEPRVLLWLARAGMREEVERLVVARRFSDGQLPTRVVGEQVRGVLEGLPPGLPEDLLVVGARQSSLRTRLTRLWRVGDDLELEIFAAIRFVEQQRARATVTLVGSGPGGDSGSDGGLGERRVPAEVVVHTDPAVTRWMGQREQSQPAGRLVARAPMADLAGGPWRVEVTLAVDDVRRSAWVSGIDQRGSASRARLRGGLVEVDPSYARVGGGTLVVEADARDGEVRLELSEPVSEAVLVGAGVRLPGEATGPTEWRFGLFAGVWGLPTAPAPTGDYRLEVDGRTVPAADALLDRLPEGGLTPTHRTSLRVDPAGGFTLRLDPPLADEDVGPRAQALLQAGYARVTEPVDPELVYFQCFTGTTVTDHPAAIQRELHRRGTGVRMKWLVADSSAGVPPGAEAVLLRSREWYDVLARAGFVVTNNDLERWFRRRPGQEVLQTYHGYPSKRMGIDQWRARRFPESRISQDLARSSGTWTALLTPQPDADVHYREQYAYDGRILALGYPRDDVLVGPERGAVRAETRERLGVGDRKVLLYAPTWRDDLATNFRAAIAAHHLDLEGLAAELGEGWVVLLRGHRFHAPAAAGGSAARVLDVTSYPEINDLILAADAAVLDYSSLRFDFALTGRPAVYLVPDLDRYTGRVRGFLQDYRTTAPGPLVDSTADVARELTAYDDLSARWSGPIADFNATFNSLADGHAAERVVDAFFARLLPPGPEPG